MDSILDKADFALLKPLALNDSNVNEKEIITLSLFSTLKRGGGVGGTYAKTKNSQKDYLMVFLYHQRNIKHSFKN